MAQEEFIVYNGIEYEIIRGEEIAKNTGHYKTQIDPDNREIITINGTWLDSEKNIEEFRKRFKESLDLTPDDQYSYIHSNNYILIGNNIIKSFNTSISWKIKYPDKSNTELFDILINEIKELGYVNDAPEFIEDENTKCTIIKFRIVNKITRQTFYVYFVPLDHVSIRIGAN